MRRVLAPLALTLLPMAAPAQQADSDQGFLTELLQDTLSETGREVRITGFEGALSSEATIDLLTVSDAQGIWLEVADITLQWDRSDLLSGEIDIGEFSAARISLLRVPEAESTGPELADVEATPFALPDLPVSVTIENVAVQRIELAEAFVGEPVAASFTGDLSLVGGIGTADLSLERIDGKEGRFLLDASFDNATRNLALLLRAEEGPNGIATRLLNIPDRPAAGLSITGDGPLEDFTADIALSTDGSERVAGEVRLTAEPQPEGPAATRFALDLAGDIRPLLPPRFHPFFGARARLAVAGVQLPNDGLDLTQLIVAAEQATLRGNAFFNEGGWPERIALRGRLASGTGQPVALPFGDDPIRVAGISLDVAYDEAEGEAWTARFDIDSFERPGITARRLFLEGGGTLRPGTETQRGRFTGDLAYAAEGLGLDNPDLARAVGEDIRGRLVIARLQNEPFVINRLFLLGAGIDARLSGFIKGPDDRFWTRADLTVTADDFSRFSGLAGRPIGGAGTATLSGDIQPFDGIFDLKLDATGSDLSAGIAQVDPLLTGDSTLSLQMDRDETGLRLRNLVLDGEALSARGNATLTATSAAATFDAALTDLGRVIPSLSGAATVDVDVATDEAGLITLLASGTAPQATAQVSGTATPLGQAGYTLNGQAQATLTELATYAPLIGQPLGGGATLDATGTFRTDTGTADAAVIVTTQGLRAGQEQLNRLLSGTGRVEADVTRNEAGRVQLSALRVDFPNITGRGDVSVSATGQTTADVQVRLADIGLFTPDFSGPLNADLQATQDASGWQITADAEGPAGTSARANGRVNNGGTLALDVTGDAPLGLANLYIAPRQLSGTADFALRIDGPPALSSVRGPVTINGARLAAPTLGQSLEDITGTITLGGGTARLDLRADVAGGGQVQLTGPVDLAPPFQSGLTAEIRNLRLRQAALYETTASGTIRISGPAGGGAAISGQIELGETNVQVPSSPISALGELPEVTHIGARPDTLVTLNRAGLTATGQETEGGPRGPGFPLDLVISAPSRIFVRGRGLDAELGGTLRLRGTTNAIIPDGRFSLIRGRLDILGQRFDLDEGIATLQGDFIPVLRLVASTEAATGTLIQIIVDGPADNPTIRFESTPELPQDEVLAQLLFGRDIGSISPLQAVQLASAVATLSGRGGGGVIGNVRENLNLDDFDIVTDEDGNAAVRAGKYLSENVYTDVQVGSDGTSEINLNLDLSDSVTVRGSVSNEGETSLGIFFERDY